MLLLVGLGFLVPSVGDLLERPFARIAARQPNGGAGGFVVGLALGPQAVHPGPGSLDQDRGCMPPLLAVSPGVEVYDFTFG